MKTIKAFIAGMILPAVVLPFALILFSLFGRGEVVGILSLHLIPIVWGVWNVLYFSCFKKRLLMSKTIRLIITGAGLGVLVGLWAIFIAGISKIFGIEGPTRFLPVLVAPVIYSLLWTFVVGPLNKFVGLQDS